MIKIFIILLAAQIGTILGMMAGVYIDWDLFFKVLKSRRQRRRKKHNGK